MALVPDIAILDGHKLSPAANRLYAFYCVKRNKATGGWRVPNKVAAEALKLSRNRVSEARRELAAEGWIGEGEGDFIRPLYGFPAVENSIRPVEISTVRVENSNETVEISTGHIDKDRARGTTSPNQPNQPPPHTHTDSHPARAREASGAPPGGGGVCVSIGKSRFTKPELRLYAGAEGLTEGWVTAAWRSGEWDAEVEEYLARRELALEARAPERRTLTPYHAAAQAVSSVARIAGDDVAAYIAQMPDVSEETRARLRERFLRGGEVEARAHAPP